MPDNAEFLRAQANRCARLATQVTDSNLAKNLWAGAADYLKQADAQTAQQQDHPRNASE